MIRIELDSHEVNDALQRLSRSLNDMRPVFDEIGEALTSNIQSHLGQGETPWGDPFAPLKAIRGRRVGGIPLNDTRQHIYQKITHRADSSGVDIGMFENQPIGATHQYGSARKNIPARPFLPIRNNRVDLPNSWEQEIISIIERNLRQNGAI